LAVTDYGQHVQFLAAVKMANSNPQPEDVDNPELHRHYANSEDSEPDDFDIGSTTPLKEAVKEIGLVVTCLYRLSIAIQSPASQDRLEKMEKIDVSSFEPFDIAHVMLHSFTNRTHRLLGIFSVHSAALKIDIKVWMHSHKKMSGG
jgi:hypothetical protein